MTQIVNLVLFFSKYSENSKPCLEYIIRNKLPVELIELDSDDSRKFASQCNIKIENVPSLVLILSNNDVSLYVGAPKILNWLRSFYERNQPQNTQQYQPQYQPQPLSRQLPQSNIEVVARMMSDQSGRSRVYESSSEEEYKETPLDFGDDDETPYSPTIPTIGLSTLNVNKPSNTEIMETAKRMEKEREATLGMKSGGS